VADFLKDGPGHYEDLAKATQTHFLEWQKCNDGIVRHIQGCS
jgi:hypothetical protein